MTGRASASFSGHIDDADLMCPNCVTPWKCNGPHLASETPYAKRSGASHATPDEADHLHNWYRCYGGLSPEAAAEHGIKPHWFCIDCMFGDEPPAESDR